MTTTTTEWLRYFKGNQQDPLELPWKELRPTLTNIQRAELVLSIQAFQRGEGSEGLHLMAASRAYAAASSDPEYVDCIRLFIAEENKHSGFLALYLKAMGESCLQKTWTDEVFRKLRKGMNLEISISVLLTAEVVALTYYPALRRTVSDPLLDLICDRIVSDERRHVQFQAERLGLIRKGRSKWVQGMTLGLHRFLYLGTLVAVWLSFHRAFRFMHVGFRDFWQSMWKEYFFVERIFAGEIES